MRCMAVIAGSLLMRESSARASVYSTALGGRVCTDGRIEACHSRVEPRAQAVPVTIHSMATYCRNDLMTVQPSRHNRFLSEGQ